MPAGNGAHSDGTRDHAGSYDADIHALPRSWLDSDRSGSISKARKPAQELTKLSDTHQKVSAITIHNVQSRGLPPGQCAAAMQDALSLLEGRWKLMILAQLFAVSPLRFSDLRRAIPAASEKMLIQQLRSLEAGGVVSRQIFPQVPPKVEYSLTELGLRLRPVFIALLDWAEARDGAQHHLAT